MTQPPFGVESRRARLIEEHSGSWGSSSQDFIHLATLLYTESSRYARRIDGNCSIYALTGIPMLFSTLRCFLIELYSGIFDGERNAAALRTLASTPNELAVLATHARLPEELITDLKLLYQVRHEILHPAHRPGPEADGTPDYLRSLKAAGLLQSTGSAHDYIWISQLQSHRLFQWAFRTVERTVGALLQREAGGSGDGR